MAYLCIDIETGGSHITKHPIISIGTCLVDKFHKEKRRFTFDFDINQFEKKCWDNFWSKNQHVLSILSRDKKCTLESFMQYIDDLDLKYNNNVIIISDNVAFDIAFINYALDKYLNRSGLNYKSNGKYRMITDQNSFLWAYMPEYRENWIRDDDVIKKFNLSISTHKDHLPDNDAEQILDMILPLIKIKIWE